MGTTALRVAPAPLPASAGAAVVRVLDITKFYAAASGGVRTYLDAKMRFLEGLPVQHALVVPGGERRVQRVYDSTVYQLPGPAIPFSPGYRLLTSVPAVREILDQERPDVVEVGSPFLVPVVVRRAVRADRRPALVGFYHSDLLRAYVEPYVPGIAQRGAGALMRAHVRRVYNAFDVTVAGSSSVAA